jgi:hypothetical protein
LGDFLLAEWREPPGGSAENVGKITGGLAPNRYKSSRRLLKVDGI